MKKNFLIEILKKLTIEKPEFAFVDVDFSAAHTRIARYLLFEFESELDKSLEDPNFWEIQVNNARTHFEQQNLDLTDKTIKKLLKVGLYTSLNGGNPTSKGRMIDNLFLNAEKEVLNSKDIDLQSIETFYTSKIYRATEDCFNSFKLINEIKSLNHPCAKFHEGSKMNRSYTIDRMIPYEYDSKHLGISRVLQGFEVVLLTVLVKNLLKSGALPASLDHDGALVVIPAEVDPFKFCEKLSNSSFKKWSKYFLRYPLPIEPKRLVKEGHIHEF
jgi:hypothetical protein